MVKKSDFGFNLDLSETAFEKLVLDILKKLGYQYLTNKTTLTTQRLDARNPILNNVLLDQLKKINPTLDLGQINQVYSQIYRNNEASIMESNYAGLQAMRNGIKIKFRQPDNSSKTITAKIVDWDNLENNQFHFSNQFYMIREGVISQARYPDVVLFLNGLPIVVIELKRINSTTQNALTKAQKQIRTYQQELTNLFTYNIFSVVSDYNSTKFAALNDNPGQEKYFFWWDLKANGEYDRNSIKTFSALLDRKVVLNLLKDFTFFLPNRNSRKIASYHQFYAANKGANAIIECFRNQTLKPKKAGIIWHTQGSGKTLTMVFTVKKVIDSFPETTVLLVTDRKDLDEQIFKKFLEAGDFLNQDIVKIRSRNELYQKLKTQKQNGIFTTMLQKFNFEKSNKVISERKNILVISDEAHRSQREIEPFDRYDWKLKDLKKHESFAHNLRTAFPRATFIGFTGTPIENSDHKTTDVFGNYRDKYLMDQAELDQFTVGITYEFRRGQWNLDQEKLNLIDEDFEKINAQLEQESKLSEIAKKTFLNKITSAEIFLSNPDRIRQITIDFIKHYERRQKTLKDKAMFIASSRQMAYKYYLEMLKFRPQWKELVRIIVTSSATDGPRFNHLIKSFNHEESANAFKDPDHKFKIAIVVDKWLTGFDVPSLDVIYIDRLLRMHNLMQAIARVNRLFVDKSNPNLFKSQGLIVDYIGLGSYLKKAVYNYTLDGRIDSKQIINLEQIEDTVKMLKKTVDDIFTRFGFEAFDLKKWQGCDNTSYRFEIMEKIQENIYQLGRKTGNQNSFILDFINISDQVKKFFSPAKSYLKEHKMDDLFTKVQLILLVKKRIFSLEVGQVLLTEEYEHNRQKLTKNIADLINFNKIDEQTNDPTISLKDIKFYLEKINLKTPVSNLEFKKFSNVVKKFIFRYLPNNFILCKKLSETLAIKTEQYNEDQSIANDVIGKIKEMILTDLKSDEKLKHLNTQEKNFYKLLLDHKVSEKHTKLYIENIAKDIYNRISNRLDKDWKNWHFSSGTRNIVQAEIKMCLFEHQYPKKVIDQILSSTLLNNFENSINMMDYTTNHSWTLDFDVIFAAKQEKAVN